MINVYGVDFDESEVQIVTINGQLEWVVNVDGMRRLAKFAPNQEAAAQLVAFLESRERGAA